MNSNRKKFWLDIGVALVKDDEEGQALEKFVEIIKSSKLSLDYEYEKIIYKYLSNKDDNYLRNLSISTKELIFPLREIYFSSKEYNPLSLDISKIKSVFYTFFKQEGYKIKLKHFFSDNKSKKLILLFDLVSKRQDPILDRHFSGNKTKNKPSYFLVTFTKNALFFKEESSIIKKHIRGKIVESLSDRLKIKFKGSLGKAEVSFKDLFNDIVNNLTLRQLSLRNTDLPNSRLEVISKKNIEDGIKEAIDRLKNNKIINEDINDVDSFLLNTDRILKVKIERKIKDYYRTAIEFVLDTGKLTDSEERELFKTIIPSKIYVNKDEKDINEDLKYLLKKKSQLDYYKKSLLENEISVLEGRGILKLDNSSKPPVASINEDNLYKEIFNIFKGSNPRNLKNLGTKKIENISKLLRAFSLNVGGEKIVAVYGNPRKNSAQKFKEFYLTNSKGKPPLFIVRDEDMFTKYELKEDVFVIVPDLLAECVFKKNKEIFLKDKIIELKTNYRKNNESFIKEIIPKLEGWIKDEKKDTQTKLDFEKNLGHLINYIFYSTFVIGGGNIPDFITCVNGERGVLFWDSKFWTGNFTDDEEEKKKIKKYILAGLKEKTIKENGGLKAHILTGYIKDKDKLEDYFKSIKLKSFKDVQLKYVDFSFVKRVLSYVQSTEEKNLIMASFYDKFLNFILNKDKNCFYEDDAESFLKDISVPKKIDFEAIKKEVEVISKSI